MEATPSQGAGPTLRGTSGVAIRETMEGTPITITTETVVTTRRTPMGRPTTTLDVGTLRRPHPVVRRPSLTARTEVKWSIRKIELERHSGPSLPLHSTLHVCSTLPDGHPLPEN